MTQLDMSIPYLQVFPPNPTAGALGVLVPEGRLEEIGRLESERRLRDWTVRAVLSDHVALAGGGAMRAEPQHRLLLNESPLVIYVHFGGNSATFLELVADERRRVQHVSVVVETTIPSNAFLLARQPINALLDVLARNWHLPLVIQRLDLMSPEDGGFLAHQTTIPYPKGVALGPLGGFQQVGRFATYDAVFREAIATSSPFYKLLCAYRIFEGLNDVRRWLRELADQFGETTPLPKEAPIAAEELADMGFPKEWIPETRRISDLADRLRPSRDAIAHFLVSGRTAEAIGAEHVYLADGYAFQHYAVGGAVLLEFAARELAALRSYYGKHFESKLSVGSVLPMLDRRDLFKVRDPFTRGRPGSTKG